VIAHYDLFAGIGGFSIALEEVFTDEPIRHVFCEWEQFPTAVLKRHWPDGEFWGGIAELVTHTEREGRQRGVREATRQHRLRSRNGSNQSQNWTIVTGGFPCQPFSVAGRRKGTADDRYQWPNMFAVIRHTKPEWVIAENVRGLVTWNDGMVLEQVCSDLEAEGYEVQPLIIPAVAVGAPHRRDRVWIIGHAKHDGCNGSQDRQGNTTGDDSNTSRQNEAEQSKRPSVPRSSHAYPDWDQNWQEVAFATCDDSVDDGLPRLVDGIPYSRAKWRRDSLKAYGNGIVPQVAIEIMKAIKETTSEQTLSND
jgi:DNA-methyltransferase (dcm)